MFNWSLTGEKGRRKFVNRMFKLIVSKTLDKGFDYVQIQSITNMGLIDSQLILTAAPWDWKNGNVIICLPPSPNGGVSFSIVNREGTMT
jgi:hypothetical protein